MTPILYSFMTFLISSIPFSLFIGKFIFKVDIRQFGDGNPGATNVLRATNSKLWYIVAILADALKGTIPVFIAYWLLEWADWRIIPVGIVAVAGHAFSPYLNFNGGKSVAITGGIWAALTLWEVPIVMGIALTFWFKLLVESEWAVILTMLCVLVYLILFHSHHPYFFGIWLGNFAILVYKHRHGLQKLPTLASNSSRK